MSTERRVDLVLEGGGVKGIGLVGALDFLSEREYQFQNIAGASAGAIVASLTAAGYTTSELHSILSELEFEKFKDSTWEDHLGGRLGEGLSILLEKGIYKGDYFHRWIAELLEKKDVHTFADLVVPDCADQPEYRYRLQVVASDITAHRLLVLPRDAHLFGVEPDDLPVADAVRMSMGIPVFFEPWRWRPTSSEKDHLIVDGGVLSNFPVWIFDSKGEPPWPTFGLMLVEPEPREKSIGVNLAPAPDVSVLTYAKDLVTTMLEARDRLYLEDDVFVRTIAIPTLGVSSTDFELSKPRAEELFQAGRSAAATFLKRWDFPKYKARFRAKAPPTRRELLDLTTEAPWETQVEPQ
jgi:NTE family protein